MKESFSTGFEKSPNMTKIKNYENAESAPDERTCALFVTGSSSNPELQFDLVFQDLVKNNPGITVKYADFGQEAFDPNEISTRIADEVSKNEFKQYLVIGASMGGQLAYDALVKLDKESAEKTTGILFSTPSSEAEIHNANRLANTVLKKGTVGKFLDKYRKTYWKMFAENKNTKQEDPGVQDLYAKKRAYEMQFPVDTFFSQGAYFYGFKADKAIDSKLVVVDATQDNFVTDDGGWDAVASQIEHKKIPGKHADSILGHVDFAKIIGEEIEK